LVTAGKHVNNIRVIARQPPIAKIKILLEAVFVVGCAPRIYCEDPRPDECSSVQAVKKRIAGWCEMAANLVSCELRTGS
jgi:hypothetical protein